MTINYKSILEESYSIYQPHLNMSKLGFLGEVIFKFETDEDEVMDLLAKRALGVCVAINDGKTFEYVGDRFNVVWYYTMVNMPFFVDKLGWGISIRGAWWDTYEEDHFILNSCDLYNEGDQMMCWELTESEWALFIEAMVEFVGDTL